MRKGSISWVIVRVSSFLGKKLFFFDKLEEYICMECEEAVDHLLFLYAKTRML